MSLSSMLNLDVTIRKQDTSTNKYGKPSGNYVDYKTVKGFLNCNGGNEVASNGVINISNFTLMIMPESVCESDRIRIDNTDYEIVLVNSLLFGRNPHLELTLIKVV